MNPKVEEHIKRMKEDERITKEEILIALGLFEIEYTREYHDNKTFVFNQWDNEKKKYYRIKEKKSCHRNHRRRISRNTKIIN